MSEIEIGSTEVNAQHVVDAIEDSGLYEDGSIVDCEATFDGTTVTNGSEVGPVTVLPDHDDDTWGYVIVGGEVRQRDVEDVYDRATKRASSWENELKETFEAIDGASGTEITIGEPTGTVYGDAVVFVQMGMIDGAWQTDSDTGFDAINGDVKYIQATSNPNSSAKGGPFESVDGEGLLFYVESSD